MISPMEFLHNLINYKMILGLLILISFNEEAYWSRTKFHYNTPKPELLNKWKMYFENMHWPKWINNSSVVGITPLG